MSGFGIHAGLALAGVVAGLPVAAVVQWHREPPAEVWSRIGRSVPARIGNEETVFGRSHTFALSPDGLQITSLDPCGGAAGHGSYWLTDVVLAPSVLAAFGTVVLRIGPTRRRTIGEGPVESVDGVVWHRIRLSERP